MTKKEKEVLLRVLQTLKESPYLWNRKNENYSNRDLRNEGYKALLKVYKKYDESATLKTLKKKLDNMRTNFYKELNKVKESKQNGAGPQDVYVPSLWYFDAFSFLDSTTDKLPSTAKLCRTMKKNEDSSTSEDEISQSESSKTSEYKPPKKRCKRINGVLDKKQNIILETAEQLTARNDEGEIIGKAIAVQLKDLKKEQLTIARKLISDVIYYASLERLNEGSKVVCKKHRSPSSSSSYQYEYNQPSSSPYYEFKLYDKQCRQSPLLVSSPPPSPPNGFHSLHSTPLPQHPLKKIIRPSPQNGIPSKQKVYINKQRSSKTNILSPQNFPKNSTDMTVYTLDLQQSNTLPDIITLEAEETRPKSITTDPDEPHKSRTRPKTIILDHDVPPKPNTRSKTLSLDDDELMQATKQPDTNTDSDELHSNTEFNNSEQLNLSLESISQMDTFSEMLNSEHNVPF